MKHFLVSLPLVALVGCMSAQGTDAGGAIDTGPEKLHLIVPEGSKIGYSSSRPGIQIVEYVPANQSVEHWTDMITVVIMERQTAPDLDALFQRMTDTFARGCDVEASIPPPTRFLDGKYPAGIQSALCGKTKKFGQGEAVVYKAIQGTAAFFQVQRAWRFPPVARSQDLPLTKEMIEAALSRLDTVHVCDSRVPGQQC